MSANHESRSRSFVQNMIWSFALQLVTLAVGFLIPRAIIAVFGSTANGLVSSLTQFISYFSLVEAGISAAAIYALYNPLSENNRNGINVIVSSAKRFYYKSGWIFLILIALLAIAYPLFIKTESFTNLQVAILVFSLGISGVVDFFTLAKYRVILTASQKNWVIQIANIMYKVLYGVVVLALAYSGFSIEIVYAAAVLPVFARSLLLTLYTRKKFPYLDYHSPSKDYKLAQRWDAFYLQILGVVQNGAPIIIATFLLQDLQMISVLSIYLMIANAVQSLGSAVGTGTQATFGNVIAKNEIETLKQTYREFEAMSYTLTAAMCSVAVITVNPFVELYTARITEITYVYPILGFLAIANVYLYHLKTPQGLLVISAGMYRETRIQTSVQTLVLLAGAILFGWLWGASGVIFGSCLSNLYRVIDLMFFVPKHIIHSKPSETARKMLLSTAKATASVLPFLFMPIPTGSWIGWLLLFCSASIWSLVSCLVLCALFERKEFISLARRVRRVLRAR